MVYLTPNDTYSLVGAVAPPPYVTEARERARESSTVYPAAANGTTPTGELHGVLSRGRGNWYSPLNADRSGLANLGLYEIVAQAPTSFPQFTGDQLAAFQNISRTLCQGDNCIRNTYPNLNATLETYYDELTNMKADNKDCADPNNATLPFCIVRKQLLTELKDAIAIQKFYTNVNSLWSVSGTVSIYASLSAYDNVKASIPAPPTAQSPSLVRPLVNFFLGLASFIPEAGTVAGIADTAFNLGMDLATDQQGNKTVDLTSTIGELEDQAIAQFKAEGLTTGTLFNIVFQDYNKFSTLGSDLLSASATNGSPWYWDPSATARALEPMQTAVTEAAYQNVMAAAYAIGSYKPETPLEDCSGNPPPNEWVAFGGTPLYLQPWSYKVVDKDFPCPSGSWPDVSPFNPNFYVPYTYPNDPNANDPRTGTILADNSWLAISLQTSAFNSGPTGHYDPPDQSLLSNLFTPASQGGLGVYRPAFFEGWPFPHLPCVLSSGNSSTGGCPWSSGTRLQRLPPPSANVSIRATQISTNQTEKDVLLTVYNGTRQKKSIEIDSVSLRTLAGSGQATVQSPAVPILIKGLAVGDSTNVVLKLNIPRGITKLEITAQGSVARALISFSSGQVLNVNK